MTPGDTHIYVGTSGWVSTFLDYQTVDINAMITGVLSAIHGHFNYYAELETAGKCYEWVKNHLALDEINISLEGICYHLRWLLECEAKKVKTSDTIRFVGGGSLSPVICQILADITGRKIETVNNAQEVGAMGAAIVVAAGLTGKDVKDIARRLVKANCAYLPDANNREIYERNYGVFKKLYKSNAAHFKVLNS